MLNVRFVPAPHTEDAIIVVVVIVPIIFAVTIAVVPVDMEQQQFVVNPNVATAVAMLLVLVRDARARFVHHAFIQDIKSSVVVHIIVSCFL